MQHSNDVTLRGMMSSGLIFEPRDPITGHLAFAAHSGGKAGIDVFTQMRSITIATQPGHTPL
jgi:hypothetical protein